MRERPEVFRALSLYEPIDTLNTPITGIIHDVPSNRMDVICDAMPPTAIVFFYTNRLVQSQSIKKGLQGYSRVAFKFREPVRISPELLESQREFFLKTSLFYFLLFFHPFDV